MSIAVEQSQAPVSTLDPWSEAFIAAPYQSYAELRALAPVVYLEKYGIWATARHDVAVEVLNDWETFCSSGGAGLANLLKDKPWRVPSLILEADPPVHTKSRAILARILSPAGLRSMRERFEAEAESLVGRLVRDGSFDGMTDLAEPYPLKVFPDSVGLSADGREHLVLYGQMVFAGLGPENDSYRAAMAHAPQVIPWINEKCGRAALAPGGFGARIYDSVDSGELTEDEAGILIRSFLSAGIDTTVSGIGNLLYSLATHPDQYALLRADPSLARPAFEEALRFDGSAPFVFRTTARPATVRGLHVPEKEKLLVMVSGANRDPEKWPDADRFDITRRPVGHVGFGSGIHGCVGQMVARLEAECILGALARHAGRLELAGEPIRRPPGGLRTFASLPLRVH